MKTTPVTILILMMLAGIHGSGAESLRDHLVGALNNSLYTEPSEPELRAVGPLFRRTLAARQWEADLAEGWSALGYELTEVKTKEETLVLLREKRGAEKGRGLYLFRPASRQALVWEAPHPKTDLQTGVIALELFLEGQARAAAWSTISRKRADMAHVTNTFFHQFTLAAAEVLPRGFVVQLHGFEDATRCVSPGGKVDLIVSSGRRRPPTWFGETVRRLRLRYPEAIRVYPDDIRQLGGTRNAQSLALDQRGHPGFLHLEMSPEFRDRLRRSASARASLMESMPPQP